MVNEGERIDDLQLKGLKIIQNPSLFCFGMDAVLLSEYARIKDNSTVIDLGTGNGILPLLLSAKNKLEKIIGIEIVKQNVDLANRSIKLNKLENIIEIVNEDINNLKNIYSKNMFDCVVTNPPYKKINSGIINTSDEKAIAKHEIKCTLEDIIKTSSYLLKQYGLFYMVNRPERLADTIEFMRKYKIEPKKIKFVLPYKDRKPNLFLIHGIKNAKPFLDVESNLIVRNNDGTYTKEILEIYKLHDISV